MSGRGLRPLAFFVAMVAFGLRLDTAWQGTANLLLVGAAVLGLASLRPEPERPFVRGDEPR